SLGLFQFGLAAVLLRKQLFDALELGLLDLALQLGSLNANVGRILLQDLQFRLLLGVILLHEELTLLNVVALMNERFADHSLYLEAQLARLQIRRLGQAHFDGRLGSGRGTGAAARKRRQADAQRKNAQRARHSRNFTAQFQLNHIPHDELLRRMTAASIAR